MKNLIESAKYITLVGSLVPSIMAGKIQTQDDIVTMAKIIMTDLEIDFKEALTIINQLILDCLEAKNNFINLKK